MGERCPFINLGFMRPVSMPSMPKGTLQLPNQQAAEIVFQLCPCVKKECKFYSTSDEECKIILFIEKHKNWKQDIPKISVDDVGNEKKEKNQDKKE